MVLHKARSYVYITILLNRINVTILVTNMNSKTIPQDVMCCLTNNTYESLDNIMLITIILLDIAKAFYVVDHKLIVQKHKKIGFL